MRTDRLTHSLLIIIAGLLGIAAFRLSPSPAIAAPEVAKDKAIAQDFSHLQVSGTPDGALVFDELTGELLKISTSGKESAVQRLGALRKGEAGKWELAPGGGAGAAADTAKVLVAKNDCALLETALDLFEVDNGRYPSTEEGLQALIVQPGGLENWKGPYVKRGVPKDPWGNPYMYTNTRDGAKFDLQSLGPDSRAGGGDDIRNE